MNTSSFLTKNLEAMVAGKTPVAKWLAERSPDFAAVGRKIVSHEGSGMLDWQFAPDRTLFAVLNPAMIYRDWASDMEEDKAGVTIVVGSNLGYGINHMLSAAPVNHKIFVIEPDPEMLMACLSHTDYTPFIKAKKLLFLPPDREILLKAMQQCDVAMLYGKIQLRLDIPSQQMGREYAYWHRVCREILENMTVELATLRHRQDIMVGNELDNFHRAMTDGSIRNMEGAAKGVSAVLYGAGPSLAEFGPRIAASRSHCLHVTALQTLPALKKVGITPDFCMAIDYSEGMRKVYDRLDREWARNIPLLYSVKMQPDVVAAYPGPTIPIWTLGGLASFVLKDREYVLDAAGNVSVALARLLDWMGVNQILLVGQDFAWKPESATHVAGHHVGNRKFEFNERKHVKLENADGDTLYSSLSYLSALRDLERDIRLGRMAYYNLYGGGAVVKGARNVDMTEVLFKGLLASEPGRLEKFCKSLEYARTPNEWPAFEPRSTRWATDLHRVQKRLEKLFKKPAKNQAEIYASFRQAQAYIKQDPLYLPYLFNQVMEIAALVQTRQRFSAKDLGLFKKTVRAILPKVRRIDAVLTAPRSRKAA